MTFDPDCFAALRGCAALCGAGEDELRALLEDPGVRVETIPRGGAIDCASQGGRLGVLLSGRARAGSARTRATMNRFGPGDTFGAATVFAPGGIGVTTAVTACRVLFLPGAALEALLRRSPDAAMGYIRFLAGRAAFLGGKIGAFTAGSATRRVALLLRARGGWRGSLSELAAALDLSRTSLYRALEALSDAGAAAWGGKNVEVKDPAKLEPFCAEEAPRGAGGPSDRR